ncbi:hypothetical protein MGA3_00935 [Bacillus methanolicus MGA3]|nr:hypothetical protein MGA3_00935 [Bacillus methanolicus MGA3]
MRKKEQLGKSEDGSYGNVLRKIKNRVLGTAGYGVTVMEV